MFSGDDVVDDATYDKNSGKVTCLMDAKFGPQFWELPRVRCLGLVVLLSCCFVKLSFC